MKTADSLYFLDEFTRAQSGIPAIYGLTATPAIPVKRSPRNGKVSVSDKAYLEEQQNLTLKSKMEAARNQLSKDFGAFPTELAKLRLERGYSQTALANAIGTSQSHIAKIEAKELDVKFSTAVKIAEALAVSLDQLKPLIFMKAESSKKFTAQAFAL